MNELVLDANIRELTLEECREINGGAAPLIPILIKGGIWLVETVAAAAVGYAVWKGLDYVFYS